MKTKYIVYGILLIGLTALIVYRINANNEIGEPKLSEESSTATTVKGLVLQEQEFNDNISLSGTIEANEQIEIRSEISGVVESINFEEGSKVVEGQVLFTVNDVELQAQLSKVQTAQKLASENERRAKLLLEKQAISQEEYEIASADFQSASAESQLIQAQLSKTIVRAPFSGTIGLRSISKGTYVTPLTPIAKLVNTSKLKITFSIPEKYASQVEIGTNLTFTTSDANISHEATVYAIEPEVEIATRTLKMRAIAENSDGKIYPGTYANVLLPLESVDNALLVPSESLIPVQNGKRIFISEKGRAKEIDVEIGTRTGNEVRVLTGLKAGDTILTYGVMALKNGTPVEIDFNQPEARTGE
ncbi:efflux RND transporter periplasmic adaptor subunit [Maribacter dokdonensis]|uniref:Membrane fusion protein, multidrug efflux system n=1 Tax=Maribacter dokdonensis TaxID=320912 RepID=A0A1H4U7W7_9FLAO|nr:efflux RND transporter periplasmic adaptor subunit [Maribacter dokdonensis]MBU2902137.1 efflux RND transporter periplasmic adaptor subunit [Maribacter dokdonensis]CAG2533674.1 membrane fusion protein [Maribacter dokdonensis]SEC64341.1 membrane fusion protein, multidrug efflux system [Maribacter dokdonensis]